LFRDGLQVIIKVTRIELTPEQPSFNDINWHTQSILNEHICALAMYFFDAENITEYHLSFHQTDFLAPFACGWQIHYSHCAKIFGVDHRDVDEDNTIPSMHGAPACQILGPVKTPKERFLAWLSMLDHRVEPFQLLDPTRSGFQDVLFTDLVDPHHRICSNRNVPSQRHDWWIQAAVDSADFGGKGLPTEIVDVIATNTDGWAINFDGAQHLKEEAEQEKLRAEHAVAIDVGRYQWADYEQ
jgi:hypothetical protein